VNGSDIVNAALLGSTNNEDTLRGVSIGGSMSSQYSLIGNIAELLVVDAVLDVEMVQKIVGFLAYVHGLQALLPATHPYKSDYPVAEVGLAPPEITPIPPFPLLLDNMILHDPVDGYNPTHRHFLGEL